MSHGPGSKKVIFRRAKWVILVTILVSMVIDLGYLFKGFQKVAT